MQTSITRLAAAAALTAVFALSLTAATEAQVQTQSRAGSLAPQPNTANPDGGGGIPTNPKPARPATGGGGFKAQQTQCMPTYTQKELTLDSFGNLQYMTCQSPIIECPEPAQGYKVGLEVVKQVVNAEDGRYRIQYRCHYPRING